MTMLSRLFSGSKPGGNGQRRKSRAARLTVEILEDRTVPSTVKVVPLTQSIDNQTTFHRLVDALAIATAAGDIVQIEPGATADLSPVTVTNNNITIQSDPNTPGTILPSYDLTISGSSDVLSRLNLGSVTLNANASSDSILRCTVDTITVLGDPSGAGSNVIDQNVISGSIVMIGDPKTAQAGNTITNNTISSFTPSSSNAIISVVDNSDVVIQNNQITGQAPSDQVAISVTRGVNQDIGNNTISLNGSDLTTEGIVVQNPGGGPLMTVAIDNNTIATGLGVGLFINAFSDTNMQASVQGNDFHGNNIGVEYQGSGGTNIASDLGGGSNNLGTSLGGNNFRGYPANGASTNAAIVMSDVGAGSSLAAEMNIFNNPATAPNAVFVNGDGGINTTQALNADLAFVQVLYNDLLGRTGTIAELDTWVKTLNASSNGQANVVSGILRSTASLDRIVNSYYLKYLGRTADSTGQAYWVNLIQNGTALETIQAGFISSAEFRSNNDSDYVQGLYRTFFDRTGSVNEVAYWYTILQQPNGLETTAEGFTASTENRSLFVQSIFTDFLHTTATQSDVNFYVNQTGDLLSLEQQILSTPQFFTGG
jgi:hypothetical protein